MNQKIISVLTSSVICATSIFAAEDAEALRAQLEDLTQRLDAIEKTVTPKETSSWTNKIKVKGDLRYRFQTVEEAGDTTKNRQRIRARLGAYAEVNKFTTAGIRIRTGKTASSANQTIGDSFDAKDIYFDLAYLTMAPADAKYGSVTLGKMKYPWRVTTSMIWDSDVNPEGAAYKYSSKMNNTHIFASAGYFKVEDEKDSTHDLNLASAQVGITQALGEKVGMTLGGSYFDYDNELDFSYLVRYGIAEGFAELSVKEVLPIPFKICGNYINNTEESSNNEGFCVGIKLGSAKKNGWEAKVGFRDLDANAAPEDFVDSDFAGGETDVKGAWVKAKYNICKNLQIGCTYIDGEKKSTDTDVDTFLLDLIACF